MLTQLMAKEQHARQTVQKSKPKDRPAAGKVAAIAELRLQRYLGSRRLQRMTVSQPGDSYEQEAEQVADRVMRMTAQAQQAPNPSTEQQLQRKCACEEDEIQRMVNDEAAGSVPTPINKVLKTGGQPLDLGTREYFETRFGRDFSHVRVHADRQAAESASSVNAIAYTVGNNIVFGQGQYAPGSYSGKRLMAHELTHVVQQSKYGSANNKNEGSLPIRTSNGSQGIQRFADIGQETYSICTNPPYYFFEINTLCTDSNANTTRTYSVQTGTEEEWRDDLRTSSLEKERLFLRSIYISDAEYESYAVDHWEGLAPNIPTMPSRAIHTSRPDDMTASRTLTRTPTDDETMAFAKAVILRGGLQLHTWPHEVNLLSMLIAEYQSPVLEGEARAQRIFTQQQAGLVIPASGEVFQHPQETSIGTAMMASASAQLEQGIELYLNNYLTNISERENANRIIRAAGNVLREMAEQLDQFSEQEKTAFEGLFGLAISALPIGSSARAGFLRDAFKLFMTPILGSAFFDTGEASERLSTIRSRLVDDYIEHIDYLSLGYTREEGQTVKESLQSIIDGLLQ